MSISAHGGFWFQWNFFFYYNQNALSTWYIIEMKFHGVWRMLTIVAFVSLWLDLWRLCLSYSPPLVAWQAGCIVTWQSPLPMLRLPNQYYATDANKQLWYPDRIASRSPSEVIYTFLKKYYILTLFPAFLTMASHLIFVLDRNYTPGNEAVMFSFTTVTWMLWCTFYYRALDINNNNNNNTLRVLHVENQPETMNSC